MIRWPFTGLRNFTVHLHAVVASSIPWNDSGVAYRILLVGNAGRLRSQTPRYQAAIVCWVRFAGRVELVARRRIDQGVPRDAAFIGRPLHNSIRLCRFRIVLSVPTKAAELARRRS